MVDHYLATSLIKKNGMRTNSDSDYSKSRFHEALKRFDPENKLLKKENTRKNFGSESSIERSPSDMSYVSMISSDSNKSDYCILRDTLEQAEKDYFCRKKYSSVFGNLPMYIPEDDDEDYSEPIYMEIGTPAVLTESPSSKRKQKKNNIFRKLSFSKSGPPKGSSTFYVNPDELFFPPDIPSSLPTVEENHYAIVVIPEEGHGRILSEQLAGSGPGRTTWKSMEAVKNAMKQLKLPEIETQVQEAQFEVITSEASYYRSLTVFIEVFYSAKEFECSKTSTNSLMTLTDKHHLFSNILSVHLASEKFLNELERLWLDNGPVLGDICEIVRKHLIKNFQPYVIYLTNINYQKEALDRLSKNELFRSKLISLEQNPKCNRLPIDSFLTLPVHRLTKLELLLTNLLKLLRKANRLRNVIDNCTEAIKSIKELLKKGIDSRQAMEEKSRLINLCCSIDYKNCKPISINDTKLVMEGELKAMCSSESGQIIKNHLCNKMKKLYLILLSHVLIITAQFKGKFLVIDYAMKHSFFSSSAPSKLAGISQPGHCFILQMTDTYLQAGYSEVILIAEDFDERNRWYRALNPIDISSSKKSLSCESDIGTIKQVYNSEEHSVPYSGVYQPFDQTIRKSST